jgi:purine nucleosidase
MFALVVYMLAQAVGVSAQEAACPHPKERTPVIIIADVGIDDAGALLLALASPELDVLGVVASFGCTDDVHVSRQNAEELLSEANRTDVPVFLGPAYPFGTSDPPELGASIVHGSDGFGCVTSELYWKYRAAEATSSVDTFVEKCPPPQVHGPNEVDDPDRLISGAEFIVASARIRPGEIKVLCFSPLTALAVAVMIEPELPHLLDQVVAMGGAVDVHGNASPLAEANFAHDAAAAQLVIKTFSEGSLVLAPLDVTHQALLTAEDVRRIKEYGDGGRLFADAHITYSKAYCRLAGWCDTTPLHDAHPVMYALVPDMFTAEEMEVQVLVYRPGDDAHGVSFVDRRGSRATTASEPITVLVKVDEARFKAELHSRLATAGSLYLSGDSPCNEAHLTKTLTVPEIFADPSKVAEQRKRLQPGAKEEL